MAATEAPQPLPIDAAVAAVFISILHNLQILFVSIATSAMDTFVDTWVEFFRCSAQYVIRIVGLIGWRTGPIACSHLNYARLLCRRKITAPLPDQRAIYDWNWSGQATSVSQ